MTNENLNTHQFSLERIYIYKIFLEYNFNSNHPEQNKEEIKQFLLNAEVEDCCKNYKNWSIKPVNGDYDSTLVAEGYRLEIDKEYSDRISQNIMQKKIAYDSWKRKCDYYNGVFYSKEIDDMQSILDKLK